MTDIMQSAVLRRSLLWGQRRAAGLPAPVRQALSRRAPAWLRPPSAGPLDWSLPLLGTAGNGLSGALRSTFGAPEGAVRPADPALERRPARLAIVTAALAVGGLAAVVEFLCVGLAAKGFEVVVLVASEGGSGDGHYAERLRLRGFRVNVVGITDLGHRLEEIRPDVVSVHGAPDWAVQAIADRGVPVVETVHGMHTLFDSTSEENVRRASRTAAVVVLSEYGRQQFLARVPGYEPEQVIVIPNAIQSYAAALEFRDPARSALGLSDQFLFVSLARYCLQKNPYGLVEAFAQVAREVPDAMLVIAGAVEDDAYFSQVERRCARSGLRGRVHLRANIENPALLLAAADCFVMDSFFEGCALAPMEALTVGLPVVTSDVAGAREQLEGPIPLGYLVPNPLTCPANADWVKISQARFVRQANRDELAAAMARVARERGQWGARRRMIAEFASSRFDPDRCLEMHATILLRVVDTTNHAG